MRVQAARGVAVLPAGQSPSHLRRTPPPGLHLQSSFSVVTCEQSLISARASVMVYDDVNKKWIPSGNSSGLSKVQIYHHVVNNTYRVVGRKLTDQEVVINCAILKGLRYNQATPTFHQWRDNKRVYGLNFSSEGDAVNFAQTMLRAIENLTLGLGPMLPAASQPTYGHAHTLPHHQPVSAATYQEVQEPQQQAGPAAYRSMSMTREEAQMLMERRYSQQQQQQQPVQQVQQVPQYQQPQYQQPQQPPVQQAVQYQQPQQPPSQPQPQQQQQQPQAPPVPQHASSPGGGAPPPPPGHHRTSSAPPAQAPAPAAPPAPPPPPPPPAPAPAAAPPPPPPPPPGGMSRSTSSDQANVGGLAAALQNTKLKKTRTVNNSDTSSNSSSGSSTYGTIGRAGGGQMMSMMDEMAATLARRKAKMAASGDDNATTASAQEDGVPRFERSNSTSGAGIVANSSSSTLKSLNGSNGTATESPRPARKRLGSQDDVKTNGLAAGGTEPIPQVELDALKQDILKEMRREMNLMKNEIIDAIKMELNRR